MPLTNMQTSHIITLINIPTRSHEAFFLVAPRDLLLRRPGVTLVKKWARGIILPFDRCPSHKHCLSTTMCQLVPDRENAQSQVCLCVVSVVRCHYLHYLLHQILQSAPQLLRGIEHRVYRLAVITCEYHQKPSRKPQHKS